MARILSRLIGWLLAIAAGAVAIAFAIGNKHVVTVYAQPSPFSIETSLYTVVFAAVFVGLLIGGLTAWKRAGQWRRLARQRGRLIADLETENKSLRAELATPVDTNAAPALPQERVTSEQTHANAA